MAAPVFDLASAKGRMEKQLGQKVDALLQRRPLPREWTGKQLSLEDKMNGICTHWNDNIPGVVDAVNSVEKDMISMGLEVLRGSFWHAADYFEKVRQTLSAEDQEFYARFIIEQARVSNESERGWIGNAWLVKKYNDGTLKEFMSEELLVEAVNRGFWEIANEYLTKGLVGPSIPVDYYKDLMKHKHLLDFAKFVELRGKQLRACGGWPDQDYIELFEAARSRLSLSDQVWFAHPIIEDIIDRIDGTPSSPGETRDQPVKELEPYKGFMDRATREMIKGKALQCLEMILDGGEDAYFSLVKLEAVVKLTGMSEQDIIEFVSASIKPEKMGNVAYVMDYLPMHLLNGKARSEIAEELLCHFEHLQETESRMSGKRKPLVPGLKFIQTAVNKGFIDKSVVVEKIRKGLEEYLSSSPKQRPSAERVDGLLKTLEREFVGDELYKRVINQGILDLLNKGWKDPAKRFILDALRMGLLDRSRVDPSKFGLMF